MFCPKCGTDMKGDSICDNCGFDISTVNQESSSISSNLTVSSSGENYNNLSTYGSVNFVRFLFFGMAAIVLVMFFMAANKITTGGNEIMKIQSVGGETLEEAYYQNLGSVYAGYAMVARAFGVLGASVLVYFGIRSK